MVQLEKLVRVTENIPNFPKAFEEIEVVYFLGRIINMVGPSQHVGDMYTLELAALHHLQFSTMTQTGAMYSMTLHEGSVLHLHFTSS